MPSIAPAVILIAALATACTTLSPKDRLASCQATDWSNYGQNDGILGVPASERAGKFADCAELGAPAEIAAYEEARAEGLLSYCTVENGYEVGRAGRAYKNVCPAELEQDFLQGYEQGRKERPVKVYPAYRFGLGYGYFGYNPYWFGVSHRRHGIRHDNRRGKRRHKSRK